jgi:pimeloyl-ACP methyl ester carboxylesterase
VKRLAALGVATCLSLALVTPAVGAGTAGEKAGSGPATRAAEATVPTLSWRQCRKFKKFECTKARVPLDYDEPAGDTIRLRLTRLPAGDPANRIGSIFLNPGGPGGSGVGFVQAIGRFLFSDEVRARFDLVGFDPRGIVSSTPIQCFDTTQDAVDVVNIAPFFFPVSLAEEKLWIASDGAYSEACADRAGPIMDHMSTANVARDMDLLRRAVGDEAMTYAGYSYGSYVGSTYASMFPDQVRALIIDGVLDPISWSTGRGNEAQTLPVSARLTSAQGAYETLLAFFSACDAGGKDCAFSDGRPKRRYARMARSIRHDPLELPDGHGGTVRLTYADLVGITLSSMYDAGSWPDFAEFLSEIRSFVHPQRAAAALDALMARLGLRGGSHYQQLVEGFAGVLCSDSDNPDDTAAWSDAARAADRQSPYFGRPWVWISSICQPWPGADDDRYTGPFDRWTANTVLVIGNVNDPATPYQGAVSTAEILPNSRLLTLDGSGHTSLFQSGCIDDYVSTYLLTGEVPPRGAVCPVDVVPFSQPPRASRSIAKESVSATPFLLPPALTSRL